MVRQLEGKHALMKFRSKKVRRLNKHWNDLLRVSHSLTITQDWGLSQFLTSSIRKIEILSF